MTREQREARVREVLANFNGNRSAAVTSIVAAWERDVTDVWNTATNLARDAALGPIVGPLAGVGAGVDTKVS